MTDDGFDKPVIGRADTEESCFSDLFDRFWDSTVSDAVTEHQVTAIERHLRLTAGARVVVAPSRCGRLALALAGRGYDVVGVDRCPDAVDRSTVLAARAGLSAAFRYSGDLLLAEAGACDGAICIGYGLAPETLAARLVAVLKPGARALVEVERNATPQSVSEALASAGLQAVDQCAGINSDSCGEPVSALLICART